MAGGSHFIWTAFLLCCVFQASNRYVFSAHHDGNSLTGVTSNPDMDDIISKIPITLPEGSDPKNINVTSITIRTCTGMKEQLTMLNRQLQQSTLHNNQLNNEVLGLRSDTRWLKQQLATCTSTASAITGSYQTQLQNKLTQLLETFDSDTFLILKVIALTWEVTTLQKKVRHDANSTETATEISVLQEKTNELNVKKQQIERSHTNSSLILQIILLQNEMWDLQETKSRRGQTSLQLDKRILALQNQLDRKISELRGNGDAGSVMLELISVHSKITVMQSLIRVHIEQSIANSADYQRQRRQKVELLKKKILELNREENNTEITREILRLQTEVEHLLQLMKNIKRTTDFQLEELRVTLEEEKKQQEILLKQMEETNYAQAQLILKIISIMKELRELQVEEQTQTTSTSQVTTLHALLLTKEREYAKAQAEITELKRKLQFKFEECSGFENKYEQVKTEFEQKIAELNRTGDSKAALILNVMVLHNELKTLRVQISTTEDSERISKLQRQLEEKQEELNSKIADIERLIANPKIILTIIELQNEIWDLENTAANETTTGRVTELQNRLDGLISEIDNKDDVNLNLMLTIITLQSQVEHLQKQLSDIQILQTSQATLLRRDLTTKEKDLQKYVDKLNENNPLNAKLILTVIILLNQLQNQNKENNNSQAASATITKLREQLRAKAEEHFGDQAKIKDLQNKLSQTEATDCSSFEQKMIDLQNDLDAKMKALQSKSDTVTSIALQVSTLTLQLEELNRQLQNTEYESKIKELQQIIDEKTNQLGTKTEELKLRSAQPQRLLQIITLQTEIEKLAIVATNDTDYNKIAALQKHLDFLIEGIEDEIGENTKNMFKILAQRDEMPRLQKQAASETQANMEEIKNLENELQNLRNQITEKTLLLDSSDTRITNLSAQIMKLHKKIKPLEDKISYLKEANAKILEELQKRLDLTKRQLHDSERQLKETNAKNYDFIIEIADLRTQLKKAQNQAYRAAKKNINELEQQIETQQRENRKLENTNKDLKQEVKELNMCCSDVSTQCDDVRRQLQQSQEDVDHLQQHLHKKDASLTNLQQELEEQIKENNNLQHEYSNLQRQQQQNQMDADYLRQQLHEKDASLNQLQQQLDNQISENNKLKDDYSTLQNKLVDVEDQTIIASKMTFDPNTANPRIALSADNSEMSTSPTLQNVPDHPGRFDVALAVLGMTGFSAGRNYWEVSVAGKICYQLGMVSESAPRRGRIAFSPTNGFWTVVRNKQGQYKAIDTTTFIIPVQTQPLTVGILLDYKRGQISFYDAGARSHMYSFTGQIFRGKIYPFINFCVEDAENPTPIVLLFPGSVEWI